MPGPGLESRALLSVTRQILCPPRVTTFPRFWVPDVTPSLSHTSHLPTTSHPIATAITFLLLLRPPPSIAASVHHPGLLFLFPSLSASPVLVRQQLDRGLSLQSLTAWFSCHQFFRRHSIHCPLLCPSAGCWITRRLWTLLLLSTRPMPSNTQSTCRLLDVIAIRVNLFVIGPFSRIRVSFP